MNGRAPVLPSPHRAPRDGGERAAASRPKPAGAIASGAIWGPIVRMAARFAHSKAAKLARAACAAMALLAGACASDPTQGYSASSPFPANVHTVAAPIFTNATFFRDVQFDLADALVKEIEATTPWKVTSAAKADTVLSGTITHVGIRRLAKSPTTGLAEQDVLTITVDFEWRDQRTGKPLVRREAFTSNGLFVPTITSNEPIELGRFAAVQQLARDIVGTLRSDW